MGKTWNAVHLGIKSREEDATIPFFIPLQYVFLDELKAIFPNTTGNIIKDIGKVAKTCIDEHNKYLLLIFDGLDELVFSQDAPKIFFNFLHKLFAECGNEIRVLITDRTADWKKTARNANMRKFICKNPLFKQFSLKNGLPTGISYLLQGFTDEQLNSAILKYGLERSKFSDSLFELCRHPYLLELIRVYDSYPDPSDGKGFYPLFYNDDMQQPSILKRMNLADDDALYLLAELLKLFGSAEAEKFFQDLSSLKSKFRDCWRRLELSGILVEWGSGLSKKYYFKKEYQPVLIEFGLEHGIFSGGGEEEGKKKKWASLMRARLHEQGHAPFSKLIAGMDIPEDAAKAILESAAYKDAKSGEYWASKKEFEQQYAQSKNIEIKYRELTTRGRQLFEQGQWDSAITVYQEALPICNQLGLSGERKAIKSQIFQAQARKVIPFRGAQIPQFEAEVLGELEKITGKQFTRVDEVEWVTPMGFSAGNKRVTGIGLYKCGVSTLPESITKLTSLEKLYLYSNKLSTLPESIGKLKSLTYLDARGNNISTLPESIVKLEERGVSIYK